MTENQISLAHAELALLFIMRVHSQLSRELQVEFQSAEARLSEDPRLSQEGVDVEFAQITLGQLVASDPDAGLGAPFCYDIISDAIRTETPHDPSFQIDLCDSLITLADLHALAVQDVLGEKPDLEAVNFFKQYVGWDAGKGANIALTKNGGPLADLLL